MGGWARSYNEGMPELDRPAPDFELPDLEGIFHSLYDYRGKIVVVNFWSCECPHSERTDRSLMACLVQWEDQVALLNVASNRNEEPEALKEAAQRPPPAAHPA